MELSILQHNICKDSLLHLDGGGCHTLCGKDCDGDLIIKLKTLDEEMDISFTKLIQAETEEVHCRNDVMTMIAQRTRLIQESRNKAVYSVSQLPYTSENNHLTFNFWS